MKRFAIPLALILAAAANPVPAQDAALFSQAFEVVQEQWHRDEPVRFRYTKCNITGEPLHFECGSPGGVNGFAVYDEHGVEVARSPSTGGDTACDEHDVEDWAPGECRTRTWVWSQRMGDMPRADGPRVAPGHYFVDWFSGLPPGRHQFEILQSFLPVPGPGPWALAGLAGMLALFGVIGLQSRADAG